ncbi:hypothetical protein BDZ94DRAFT_1261086 [Collybia nuda]|uniref:EthD domain-containing protein n=1 Tax=Collybia nuda TaxID=64659 RepID=A0A9P5Y303_9AGAR|nr:hypothetical protein BDZ94DRAFT_1261086 [Collybia nuda]
MSSYRKVDSNQGLILVYSEPGDSVATEEFNDWYDNEHVPPRLVVPGILTSARYKAADSKTPSWIALYDITSPDVAKSVAYQSLRTTASDRENKLIAGLPLLNRRVYSHVLTYVQPHAAPSSLPGRYLLIVHMQVTLEEEEEFNRWYNEEHMDLLSKVPGWLRGRRYKLVESVYRGINAKQPTKDEKPCADYLAIHDVESDGFMDLPELKHAMQTPWREKVMKTIVGRELRRFEKYKVFKQAQV